MQESIISRRKPEEKTFLARAMRRAMTPAEDCLWQSLRGGRLAGLKFRRQQVIDGFITDFYCHEASLVVEADGGVHETSQAYDAERDRILAARHLLVLRFPNVRILNDLPSVLAEITAAAQQRTNHPLLPPPL